MASPLEGDTINPATAPSDRRTGIAPLAQIEVLTMNSPKRAQQLRRLAVAYLEQPGSPFQDLAVSAGISRRTLYRIAASKSILLSHLCFAAFEATQDAIERAQLDARDPVSALTQLTEEFIADADLYAVWVANPSTEGDAGREGLERYRAMMIAFFERGQRVGVFRSDVSPLWLVTIYDALLTAAAVARRDGVGPEAELPRWTVSFFLSGATPPERAGGGTIRL